MDSKTTFGVLLVVGGLVGVWLLITGRLSTIIKSMTNTVNTNTANNVAAGNANIASQAGQNGTSVGSGYGSSVSTISSLTSSGALQSGALAYGVRVGDAGAHIEPVA